LRQAATAVTTAVAVRFGDGVRANNPSTGTRSGGRVATTATLTLERQRAGSQTLELSLLAVGPVGSTLTLSSAGGASTTAAASPEGTVVRLTLAGPVSRVRLRVDNAPPFGIEIRDIAVRDPAMDVLFS
jgi:hypothetical protein